MKKNASVKLKISKILFAVVLAGPLMTFAAQAKPKANTKVTAKKTTVGEMLMRAKEDSRGGKNKFTAKRGYSFTNNSV